MVSRYIETAEWKKMSPYKGEKVEAIIAIGLNGGNHNYLRPLLVEIMKVYKIKLFLMDLAVLYLLLLQNILLLEVMIG